MAKSLWHCCCLRSTTTTTAILATIFLLTIITTTTDGANVLAVLPSVWQSHYLFGKNILQQLIDADDVHTVTLISGYSKDFAGSGDDGHDGAANASRLREIHIEGLMDNWLDMGLSFNIEEAHQQSMLERFTRLIYAGTANVDLLLGDATVKKLLRSSEKFDLLIIDLFLSDALLGLALHFNVPTVVISPNGANTWLNRMIGNPQSSALDPSNFLPYTERMSIWERCANTMMGLFEKLTYNFFHMISQQAVYVKHFQSLNQHANENSLPHHRDLTQNLSLALLNSHPVVQYPRAFLPNVLPVGGIHLKQPQQQQQTQILPLQQQLQQQTSIANGIPSHLKSFIESSKAGVIYISFGADARTIDLAKEKLDALYDVISSMEEFNFILKWEAEETPRNLPQNVLLNDWLPQEAILAHSNVKAFVSACGLMSVLEAINGLTPLLAIPIYPEQFVTATRLEAHGLAQIIDFDEFDYENLLNGLEELIGNESYQTQLIEARRLLHADFGTPKARFLHYIDLVLSTGGADYLKTHAHHLNFFRAKLFDVIAILALGLGGILAIPFLLICCILKRSYYNHSEEAAAKAAAAAATTTATTTTATVTTTLQRSHSKLSLNMKKSSQNNSKSSGSHSRVKDLTKNMPIAAANAASSSSSSNVANTISMPASPLQDAVNASRAVLRQLSASAFWATNASVTDSPEASVMTASTSSTSSSASTSSSTPSTTKPTSPPTPPSFLQ